MDAATLLDAVRDDHETPLSRLGSSKALYALTGGEMDPTRVRQSVADEAAAAARVFDEWAETEDDPAAADLFSEAADQARQHRSTVDAEVTDPDVDRPMYETLAGLEGTAARLGGLLARTLVSGRTAGQTVGFFVGNADPQSADTFRGVRSDIEDLRDETVAALDDVCESEDDWETAEAAAAAVVEAAYDHYVDRLESMGVKPKNVC